MLRHGRPRRIRLRPSQGSSFFWCTDLGLAKLGHRTLGVHDRGISSAEFGAAYLSCFDLGHAPPLLRGRWSGAMANMKQQLSGALFLRARARARCATVPRHESSRRPEADAPALSTSRASLGARARHSMSVGTSCACRMRVVCASRARRVRVVDPGIRSVTPCPADSVLFWPLVLTQKWLPKRRPRRYVLRSTHVHKRGSTAFVQHSTYSTAFAQYGTAFLQCSCNTVRRSCSFCTVHV